MISCPIAGSPVPTMQWFYQSSKFYSCLWSTGNPIDNSKCSLIFKFDFVTVRTIEVFPLWCKPLTALTAYFIKPFKTAAYQVQEISCILFLTKDNNGTHINTYMRPERAEAFYSGCLMCESFLNLKEMLVASVAHRLVMVQTNCCGLNPGGLRHVTDINTCM